MGKRYSVDQLAASTAEQARRELASLQGDLNRLRDGLSGLTHAIKAPVIRAPQVRTKRTVDGPLSFLGVNIASVAGLGASELLGAVGVSSGGYRSAAQIAGNQIAELSLGQRIR